MVKINIILTIINEKLVKADSELVIDPSTTKREIIVADASKKLLDLEFNKMIPKDSTTNDILSNIGKK